MPSRCGPPDFDERDWGEFDFSRWHLDGIALDAASAAFADLAERLFNSAEWREQFKARLPDLQRHVLAFHRDHARRLEEEKDVVARDFDERITAAERRNKEFRKVAEAAASPLVVQPSPDSFHVAVMVVAKKGRVGLPGLIVRMMDPRERDVVLAEHVTDQEGKALLTLPKEKAGELDKRDTALEILTPAGKRLERIADAVCIRLNQVDTKVVALAASAEIEPHQAAAAQVRSEREAHALNLVSRVERLRQEKESRAEDLKCRLNQSQELIAAIEEEMKPTPSASEPVPPPAERPERKPRADEEPPPARKRRRR